MGQSYRIRTELGVNKAININLEQEFEFLEILSLKIQQADLYTRSCSDYGVLVGRVTANNGLGIPNARVSVFIPVDSIDESDPIISSIYPYKSPQDKNEDGYRYNLLPYVKSYSQHAATGTLPSRLDVLTGNTASKIFDKYYKYTAKSNESGDYMIFGVPLGIQTIVIDIDLSDIGEFSLSPQDLIRLGLATDSQLAGNKFKTSTDLNSLPQIINITKNVDISPLWGDDTLCQIAINRLDFDLRDDANIEITPTATFLGSIFSSSDNLRVRKNSRPKDNLGNLCDLQPGPGQILAIRQTIDQDDEGNPGLEVYDIENSGNVIDGDGTWIVELPMNLDYVVTNEFGEKILSNDPTIGVPTKSKYRFKIKWQQPPTLTEQNRRAYFLVPNIKEYGWSNPDYDPNIEDSPNPISVAQKQQLNSSYYFGLSWSGYTDGFVAQNKTDRLNEIINCEDTFYEFKFNKVYTVSSLIDEWKKGGRGRFIGIKEIQNDECSSNINKFPVNEGVKNFDLLYFIVSLFLYLLQIPLLFILLFVHIILFVVNLLLEFVCQICNITIFGRKPFSGICKRLNIECRTNRFLFRLPMITYPDCSLCECDGPDVISDGLVSTSQGVLSYLSSPNSYINKIATYLNSNPTDTNPSDVEKKSEIIAEALAGNGDIDSDLYKITKSKSVKFPSNNSNNYMAISQDLPLGERINLFNSRKSYFDGNNRIKVTFAADTNPITPNNLPYHFDNTITVLSNLEYTSGQLLSTVNLSNSDDINFKFTAITQNGVVNGITGETISSSQTITVKYANPNNQFEELTQSYLLPEGSTISRQIYPMDVEYFQVITAITVSQAISIWGPSNNPSAHNLPNILTRSSDVHIYRQPFSQWKYEQTYQLKPSDYFDDFDNQYILILQRGVDPYSPKFKNVYSLGTLFNKLPNDIVVTADTRLNIPIQKISTTNSSTIQTFSIAQSYYESYFFTPGNNFSGFTATDNGYYSSLDSTTNVDFTNLIPQNVNNTRGVFSISSNDYYYYGIGGIYTSDVAKYDASEDLSGVDFMYLNKPGTVTSNFGNYDSVKTYRFSEALIPNSISYPISQKNNNILRTDRLPTSDSLDGLDWKNTGILQQNNNFSFYTLDDSVTGNTLSFTLGADQVTDDIEGIPSATNVIESFGCNGMVGLNCYEGVGSAFRINPDCIENDMVENGCYLFMRRPLIDLVKDIKTLSEWSYRFRFFYALCRGVLSQSFTNNWINGSLYAFPIQVDTKYNNQNQPISRFTKDLIYYDDKTFNFYYRSSPYYISSKKFLGKKNTNNRSVNERNLLFPTTIMDLGVKQEYYSELLLEPYAKSYVMKDLDTTSYNDTSDIVNLFVVSRITNSNFLKQLIPFGDSSVNKLFSRDELRVDGDLTQLLSINSEVGVIKFSPEFYEVPSCDSVWCSSNCCTYQITNTSQFGPLNINYVNCDNGNLETLVVPIGGTAIFNTNNPSLISPSTLPYVLLGCATNNNPVNVLVDDNQNPVIGIWFSSTTENLQIKDYLSPGRINFRDVNNQNYPYTFGITSQKVPFYQWETRPSLSSGIFGNQLNNWATKSSDIISYEYQGLDRINQPYFKSNTSPSNTDLNSRGYIFSVDSDGNYSTQGTNYRKFLIGAPNQFYFGVVKGKSALDKFKTKYIADE